MINRVRNWSKSSEARPHRGTRLKEAGTGAAAGVEGGRDSCGGGLVGTHSISLWSLDRQHLPHTKPESPRFTKFSSNIASNSHFEEDGSFTGRVCLGPQPQTGKEPSQDGDYKLTLRILSFGQIPYCGWKNLARF